MSFVSLYYIGAKKRTVEIPPPPAKGGPKLIWLVANKISSWITYDVNVTQISNQISSEIEIKKWPSYFFVISPSINAHLRAI